MRPRWLTRCAVLAVAVSMTPAGGSAAAPAPPATAGAASIGLRLVEGPAQAGSDPRARVYIVDHVALGGVIHRQIEVSNTTAASAHIALYAAAATIEHGTFVGAAGRTANDLSTWTSVAPAAPDVPAGGRAEAIVTIRVTHDAAPGEHFGVVWAEVRTGTPGGVVEVSRVGIRIYLSVGPGGPPAAGFEIASVTGRRSADGSQLVQASVRNTGGRALDMDGTLQLLSGPGGVRAGPFPVRPGTTVAVGDSSPVAFALADRLPVGPWTARIVLHSGLVERTAQAVITFPADAKPPPVAAGSSWTGRLSAAVAGLAVLLGVVAVLIMLRRRRRRRWDGAAPTEQVRARPGPVGNPVK